MSNAEPKAMRQKYWSEINEDARIERVRQELKRMIRRYEELSMDVHRLNQHRHLADGSPAMPLPRPGEGYYEKPRREESGDDVFF